MVVTKTRLIAALSGVATLLILFFVFRPSPLPVDCGVVRRGPLQVTIEGEGYTRVTERFVIAAPVTGKLLRVHFQEGDLVRKGDVVASLLPSELDTRAWREASARAGSARAALDEAVAARRRIMLNQAQAERRHERYRNLYREGAVSKESFELAENEANVLKKEGDAAASSVLAARYNLSALKAPLDRQLSKSAVEVRSPVEGRVLRMHEKSERVITAGTPVADIGDPSAIEIVVDVLSTDAVRVRPGNRVMITDWGGEKVLEAAVKRVEPAAFTKISALGIEEKRVNIVAVLREYEPKLGDNFRLQAEIVLHSAQRVLQVPVSSLFRGKTEWNLFVIEHGRALLRAVTIGMRSTYQAEVLQGVREGERVVVHPTNELQSGMRVKVME